MVEGAITHLLK